MVVMREALQVVDVADMAVDDAAAVVTEDVADMAIGDDVEMHV